MKRVLRSVLVISLLIQMPAWAKEVQVETVDEKARCPVCGMFVSKYQQWLTQVRLLDGRVETFDGVKDMMAYIFAPESYGATKGAVVQDVLVKDYYSQEWLDGRISVYVTGSDVLGPMGHELIPFKSLAGAENFFKDHHGKNLFKFSEISPDLVNSLRKGHKMKGHSMKGMKKE